MKVKTRSHSGAGHFAGDFRLSAIVVLGLLVSMGALHTDPVASSLPGMAQELGGGSNSTAGLVSAFLLGMTLGHLPAGPISDIVGRNKTILGGLCILSLGTLLCAVAPSVSFLTGGRIVQGLGAAAALCTARAIGGDSGDGLCSAKVLSSMQVISSATPIFMPLLGDSIARPLGWRGVFWMMLLIDMLLILGTICLLPKDKAPKKEHVWANLFADIGTAVKRPAFILYTLAFGFGISTFYCYVSASSFALQNELGLSPRSYSVVLSGMGVLMVGSALLTNCLLSRFGRIRCFSAAVLLQMLCAALMAVLFSVGRATVAVTILCYGLIAASSSLIIPVGLSLAVGEAGPIKGTASALCGFAQCLCSWIITGLLTTIQESGSLGAAAGLAMAATTLAALLCCALGTRIKK